MERAKMATNDEAIVQYQKALPVHGCHVYREIWEAACGETLVCVAEPGNCHDWNAVAVEKDGKVVGSLQRRVSRLCTLFLKRGGKRSLHCDYYGDSIFCRANCLTCSNFHGFNFRNLNDLKTPTKMSSPTVFCTLCKKLQAKEHYDCSHAPFKWPFHLI